MSAKKLSIDPFWIDDPNPYAIYGSATPSKGSMFGWTSRLIQIYAVFILLFFLFIAIYLAIQTPLMWIFAAYLAILMAWSLFHRRTKATHQARVVQIQQLAKDKTGADYLGSAIHTAGHPLLEVNQPVVLSLKGNELSIYNYDSSIPIDTLLIRELQAVNPVVYDDDYIPHVGVIDNTAQALQISFRRKDIEYTCSFRRMLIVRPIEWYHAIQKARLIESAG